MKIFFTIDDAAALNVPDFRGLADYHLWHLEDSDPWFGVAIPRNSEAAPVADRLLALGADVLPGLNDTDSGPAMGVKVQGKLTKHGVKSGDSTRDVAKKMHKASGFPHFDTRHS